LELILIGMNPTFKDEGIIDGRFHLKRKLGQGSFGTVWSARDTNTMQKVAVKIVWSFIHEK
jgi:hypothetical protein